MGGLGVCEEVVGVMARFRKLPVVVEAEPIGERMWIETREGTLVGEPGDWLIRGIDGEPYLCAGDIFRRTYEPVGVEAYRLWGERYGVERVGSLGDSVGLGLA